ncbi:TatD family hydrolase [Vibrio scophthalmi]|uniref:TatD family hydrolase n=1 Tax=Vibrio scophthalmi TaxID=45658 RepID=UPI002FEFF8DB
MRLFDTHCHLDFAPFKAQLEATLQEASEQGVERFLVPAIGASNWSDLIALSHQHTNLYVSLGCHPYFVHTDSLLEVSRLEAQCDSAGSVCVAVGECGLDAMIDVDAQRQEAVFEAQISVAKSLRRPLILHGRKTYHRLLQLLKQHRFHYGGILHGFSGSYQQAMQFVELGFYIGVGGVITYPRANKTRQAVTQVPIDHLVLETDAPDMPLLGYQGQANHPKRLPQVLTTLAQLKQSCEQTVAENVWKNSFLALSICE